MPVTTTSTASTAPTAPTGPTATRPVEQLATSPDDGTRTSAPALTGAAVARQSLPVLLLATALAFADGFWLTSLQGAIGAVERTQGPFGSWWRSSALALPVFVAAVRLALSLVRRRRPSAERGRRAVVLTTGLLVTALSTLAGVAWVALSSALDYALQTRLLEQRVLSHADLAGASGHSASTHSALVHSALGASVHDASGHALTLAQLVQERHATFTTHVLGVQQAAVVLLVTNALLVLWFAALRGGRLDT